MATALIALAGTLLVAAIGYYQWRRQATGESAFSQGRRAAYLSMWEKLEEINLALREDNKKNPDIYNLCREVNSLFLRNSAYLDDSDQALFTHYLEALNRLRSIIYTEGPEDVSSAWNNTWIEIPKSFVDAVDSASSEVKKFRAKILGKIRPILRG